MNAGTVDAARGLLRGLELRERNRNGGSLSDARSRIATKAGILPGTLYNLAFKRLKKIDEVLRERLSNYAVADLEKEIGGLTHELEVARKLGTSQDQVRLQRIKEALDRAQALYDEANGGRS